MHYRKPFSFHIVSTLFRLLFAKLLIYISKGCSHLSSILHYYKVGLPAASPKPIFLIVSHYISSQPVDAIVFALDRGHEILCLIGAEDK